MKKSVMALVSSLRFGRLAVTMILGFDLTTNVFADDYPQSQIRDQLARATEVISIDTKHLKAGEFIKVYYVGRPILIYRRTPSDIKSIEVAEDKIFEDPVDSKFRVSILREYYSSSDAVWARLLLLSRPIALKQRFRSSSQEFAVIGDWGPASGCVLDFVEIDNRNMPEAIFRDPCTGVQFDAAGKAFLTQRQASSEDNLTFSNAQIPPYHIENDGRVLIGVRPGEVIPELDFSREELYGNLEPTKLLIAAARYNDIDTVRAALNQGAQVNYFKKGVGSPVDAAVSGSSMEIIKLLVAHGAKKRLNTLNLAKTIGRQDVIDYLESMPE